VSPRTASSGCAGWAQFATDSIASRLFASLSVYFCLLLLDCVLKL
jgi:hypothetical protein